MLADWGLRLYVVFHPRGGETAFITIRTKRGEEVTFRKEDDE